jgi:excisionase family DNA binding protein
MELLALTIAQAAELGGPCRSALYEDIRLGRLRAVKRGRSTRILMKDFKEYLASLPAKPIVTKSEKP